MSSSVRAAADTFVPFAAVNPSAVHWNVPSLDAGNHVGSTWHRAPLMAAALMSQGNRFHSGNQISGDGHFQDGVASDGWELPDCRAACAQHQWESSQRRHLQQHGGSSSSGLTFSTSSGRGGKAGKTEVNLSGGPKPVSTDVKEGQRSCQFAHSGGECLSCSIKQVTDDPSCIGSFCSY